MIYDKDRYKDLRQKVDSLPRVNLTFLPTPLHRAPQLSASLGGPHIYFKRDDLTGLAFGGNKSRMAEFRLARAVCEGADTVIAGYGLQSNHARQIVAGSAKLGLKCQLVLKKEPELPGNGGSIQGNMLLDDMMGAKVIPTEESVSDQIQHMKDLAEELRQQGLKPFLTGLEDYELSTAAYVDCMLEICRQCEEKEINPDVMVVCSEGATQAGLVCAAKYLRMNTRIIGISPMYRIDRPGRDPEIRTDMARLANLCARTLDIDLTVSRDDIENHTRYVGEGYGIVYPEVIEAVKTVARTEGILLEPVYTGKAMVGLMDLIKQEEIKKDATVVFINTGGCPLVFLYGDELTAATVTEG